MNRTEIMQFRITREQREKLEARAREIDLSVSAVIRAALAEHFARIEWGKKL